MHATTAVQTPSPKTLTGSSPKAGESSQNAGVSSTPSKTKKRERSENTNEASKRERSVNPEEGDMTATSVKNDQVIEEVEKDGLNNVGSVEKLVSAMQQDRNDGSRKPSEFASRRTVLAAAISATESDECLERFVQLGGVALFHEWLQEAYKGKCGDGESPKDGGNKGMDELLLTILSALEKLPVDLQALRCQVGKSVNNLKSHKNVEIKEKARKLVETWKKRVGDEMNLPTGSKSGGSQWSTNMKNLPLNVGGTDMAGVQTSNGSSLPLLKASEKGSTNVPPNNGQLWNSNSAGAITWKDDVKSPSSTPKLAHRNSQGKGLSSLNAPSNKESTTAKPLVWSRNAGEKAEVSALESGTKPVIRLPRSGSAGVNEEVFGPSSQGSSPILPDQTAPSCIAEAPDAKQKPSVPATNFLLPSELSADQQQDENGTIKVETEKQTGAEGLIMSEVSRTSDSNDRAVSMAIVPVSAVSRISGSERNIVAGASGRSTVLSEAGTIDQEAPAHGSADTGVPSQCKEESRRKEAQDGGDGANCASSSSFTEMSVAGQGTNAEQKSELSSAIMEGEEALRPVEGLGESPEPRPSSRRAAGDGDAEKKPSADVSSTQGSKAPFGRTSFDGLGRRLERYDNSWDEKRTSWRKLSSEAESRKHGADLENARLKPAELMKDIKMTDSASEFVEDDALEVAQQIAKEVEQEVETSHLSSTKDDRDHLSTREPDASPGHLLEKCSISLQKKDVQVPDDSPKEPDRERKEENQEPVESTSTPTEDQDLEPASTTRAEEEKPAENVVSRPDFDLNEGLGGDDSMKEVPCTPVLNVVPSVAGPTTPIPVLPTTKGAFIPPEPPAKTKLEPGWRGSAATSAFRPAEPRRVQELQQTSIVENKESSTGKQTRLPLDIDLNVADTDMVFESQSLFVKPKQAASTLGRVDFDLNCVDDCEEGTLLEMKVESSTGLGRKDAQGTTTRDFDLNGPVEEEPTVQHVSLRNSVETTMVGPSVGFRMAGGGGGTGGSAAADMAGVAPWFPSGNSYSAVAIPAFPMARAEPSYPVQAQPFLNAGAGPIHFDLYRGGMTLATPAVAYPGNPPVPYPYAAGFPFASNYTFNNSASFPASFVEAPGSGPYPAAVSSQMGGPGAMSRYIRPHLMGIPETAGRPDTAASNWARPSLDLNTGPDAADDHTRPQQNGGGRTVALEDHLRGFGQVAQAGKRKEPESGWEVFQAGYKQPAW